VLVLPGAVVTIPVELNVDPMSPNRMFEYVTDEFGAFASTSDGFPESVGQSPRDTPGFAGSAPTG
jgi:hypothetical protein